MRRPRPAPGRAALRSDGAEAATRRGRTRRGERTQHSWRLMDAMRPKVATERVNAAIAALAQRQFGVILLAQLVELGLSPRGVSHRVAAGRLYRLHRGVYSVIPPALLRREGRWLAAVYALGKEAGLSHAAAAANWDLMSPPTGAIDVTVPGSSGRAKRFGIRIHRSTSFSRSDLTIHKGIPVTTVRRTLHDLRGTMHEERFKAVLRRAEMLRLDVGAAYGQDGDPGGTELERRMLALCRRHGLSQPRCQVVIGPYTVDFLWPERRLVVETDGFGSHGTRSAFEADRAHDADLKLMGYDVVRFTWRQLRDEPPRVVATLRALLGCGARHQGQGEAPWRLSDL